MPLIYFSNNVHAHGGGASNDVTNNATLTVHVHVHVHGGGEPLLAKVGRALHGLIAHRQVVVDDAAAITAEQLQRRIVRAVENG